MKKITLAFFMLCATAIFAQDGILDASYGTGGYVLTNTDNGVTTGSYVQPDGKIIYIENSKFRRLNANGTQDTSFGNAGVINIVQPYQYIESFTVANNQITLITKALYDIYTMGRYNLDGTVDTTLGGGTGYMTLNLGDDIKGHVSSKVASDGKLLIAGNSDTAFGSYNDYYVRKYNADGTLDTDFNFNAYELGINISYTGIGYATIEGANKLQVAPNGSVIVSGVSGYRDSTVSGHSQATFAMITDNNSQPQVRSHDFYSYYSAKSDLTFDSNGNIFMLGGNYASSSTPPSTVIQKWTAAGNIANSFGSSGVLTLATLSLDANTKADFRKILIQPDGKILLAGVAYNSSTFSSPYLILARYLQDGSLDSTFGTGGYTLHDIAHPNTPAGYNYLANFFASSDYSSVYVTGSNQQNAIVLKYSNISMTPLIIPEFTPIAPICAGDTAPVLETTSNNGVSGTWSPAVIDNMTSGTYTFTPNANQHAASTTLNVTVNQPTSSNIDQTACESYTWAANDNTYTDSGSYTYVTTNESGCTHTMTLNLTINQPTTETIDAVVCESYTWAANGNTYTDSGSYTYVTTNEPGCTHTMTLNLTVNQPTTETIDAVACGNYTWAANGNTYTDSGSYTYVTTNESGCTHTITLNLTVNHATTITGDSAQTFAEGATLADIVLSPSNVVWYASEEDAINNQNAIEVSTLADQGTYYAVNFSSEGCPSEPFAVTVFITLATDAFQNSTFRLFPNPTSGIVNVGSAQGIEKVTIINLLGQSVMQQNVSGDTAIFDVSALSSGTYLVKINSSTEVKTVKVIKQ